MLRIALVLILPCLVAADTTCPGGELKCPEGQECCTVDSRQSCCVKAQLPFRLGLMSAAINASVQNGLLQTDVICSKSWCLGQCCTAHQCCPNEGDTCCGIYKCCPKLSVCCGSECCEKNQLCELSTKTCYDGAGSMSPSAIVTLVAAWLVAYAVKKL